MKLQSKQIFVLDAPFDGSKPNAKLELNGLTVNYYRVNIYTSFYINVSTKEPYYTTHFGCQTVNHQEIKDALLCLKEGPISQTVMGFKNKTSGKFSTARYVESSDNYFITSKGTALSKNDFELMEHDVKLEPIKKSNNYLVFRGYQICPLNQKPRLIKQLEYIDQLCNTINEGLTMVKNQ